MRKQFATTWAIAALAALLLFAGSATTAQVQDKAQAAFKAAVDKEVIDGDLKGAIEQYQKISEGKDRALAAQALLRMAECYQKLGDSESRKIYEQILRNYADQKDAAAAARAKLGAATRAAMTSRQLAAVRIGGIGYGSVSPDGRYFPYTNWDNGDVYLRDLLDGTDRRLTNESAMYDRGEYATRSAFSPDGKQLAYVWYNNQGPEIRIVSLQSGETPKPRHFYANQDITGISVDDWSSDGQWLAVQIRREDGTSQLGLVAMQNASLHILKSVDWRGATKLMFSPDSRYIAYDLPGNDKADQRDVFIISTDGSKEIPAAAEPSNDVVIGWSPDGRYLLFASDRTGNAGLWAARFQDGKISGAPEAIKTDVAGAPLGVAKNGSLYLLVHHPSFNSDRSSNIQVADFDFSSGKFLSQPVAPVQTFIGANSNPRWSPDGKYLAYVSTRTELFGAEISGRDVVGIRAVETGETRELRPMLSLYPRTVDWSADGLSLITQGTDLKGRQGVYRIDAQTGEVSPIAISFQGQFNSPKASPDGRKIYYVAAPSELATDEKAIIERDLASGSERTILKKRMRGGIQLSPDGQNLAIIEDDPSTRSAALLLVSPETGNVRELARFSSPEFVNVYGWTADSRTVLLRDTPERAQQKLWEIPIVGGERKKLDNFLPALSVHPNGRRIAYAVNEPAKEDEVWVLENFLPGAH